MGLTVGVRVYLGYCFFLGRADGTRRGRCEYRSRAALALCQQSKHDEVIMGLWTAKAICSGDGRSPQDEVGLNLTLPLAFTAGLWGKEATQ